MCQHSVRNAHLLQEAGTISVWNNGPGIPVRRLGDADGTDYTGAGKKKDSEPWVPQMIFGELLTGSNYNDNEAKVHCQCFQCHITSTFTDTLSSNTA